MAKKQCIAMLLAGGRGSRLKTLTQDIAKPAVPFGGKYRIIDFALSNCKNSNINTVGILTQYQPHVLQNYIGNGYHWDLDRKDGGVSILPPFQCQDRARWYEGTANAVFHNRKYIEEQNPEHILIISGDHIYKMDYNEMLEQHIHTNADVTISVVNVPWSEANRFGIVTSDKSGRIIEFEEKPVHPKSNQASMGIYIFKREALQMFLEQDSYLDTPADFGKDIIPAMIKGSMHVFAFQFKGYWRDVGTIDSYWQSNMDLLSEEKNIFLCNTNWNVYTKEQNHSPFFLSETGSIMRSLISEGCNIAGRVEHSVLSCGVKIGKHAVIKDCVILPNTVIGDRVYIEGAVIGSNVTIEEGTVMKPHSSKQKIALIDNRRLSPEESYKKQANII
ncbi:MULTISPECIES: glucose-1-phosphate adenylyltransferase [Bacillaceae]|uniref:glucose-1-phosphate adenylyltransferase n=1 Tax=Bacillaceae TaxID=186817 RepID=UPI00101DE081|nr:glucose-1-phosphate adenylyltransferase [Ectobacillus funiculus]